MKCTATRGILDAHLAAARFDAIRCNWLRPLRHIFGKITFLFHQIPRQIKTIIKLFAIVLRLIVLDCRNRVKVERLKEMDKIQNMDKIEKLHKIQNMDKIEKLDKNEKLDKIGQN